jgi:hypothetical protein
MRSRRFPTGESRRSEKEGLASSGAGAETSDTLIAAASHRAGARCGANPASFEHEAAAQTRRTATVCAFIGAASLDATGGASRDLASVETVARSSHTDLTTTGGSTSAAAERHRRLETPALNTLANSAQAKAANRAWRQSCVVMRRISDFSSVASPDATVPVAAGFCVGIETVTWSFDGRSHPAGRLVLRARWPLFCWGRRGCSCIAS